ncbi:putative transferase CAF17 homolog, mitochondrial [Bombyx mandarina]|uniref:Transferase CAF17 homolog, mitochondrial n=1 Tax=Bombyx mandarina TaxID=7092 RepID=A0A6J2KEK1_BOMMA|nr:putative transferase CAF17 homolog, mitochondrial [Bombyx mandarina]
MLHQVKKFLFTKSLQKQFSRYSHVENPILYPLESRKLLNIAGKDAGVYLQGLITNDMRHFEEGASSIYAMFLNTKGRVLYDVLIHKWNTDDSFLLECDKNVISHIQKHLKMYKLKRLVEITDLSNEYKIHALVPNLNIGVVTPTHNVNIYKDPRLPELGMRIISPMSITHSELIKIPTKDIQIKNSEEGYKCLRYKLGVSEGSEDLPPGVTFPLEVNCDYLHGVSFHKGCYIGQELTARVHHTGVVRKRIMPIKFTQAVDSLDKDSTINASENPKSTIGKLKGYIQNYGLGLIRVKEALEAKSLVIGSYTAEVLKPTWWPMEAPKDKATVVKAE